MKTRLEKWGFTLILGSILSMTALAQDASETQGAQSLSIGEDATAQAERSERIRALRKELREEVRVQREFKRSDIQSRLAGLTEDEKAALREQRRMRQQRGGQNRQQRQPTGRVQPDAAENDAP